VSPLGRFLTAAAVAAAVLACSAPAASAAGELAITSSVRVDAPKGLYWFQPVRFSYAVRNQSAGPVTAKVMSVPVRGPGGNGLDVPCTGGADVTIPAGGTFVCDAPLDQGYGQVGTYTYWADWQGTNGAWHDLELGPHLTFTLTETPLTTLAGAGQWSAGEQVVGGARDTAVAITNTGTAALLIDKTLTLGGIHPGDYKVTGENCTQAPIAPSATCALQIRFTPAALGPRTATVLFRANTTPNSNAINLSGTGVPVPSPPVQVSAGPIVVAAPERLAVTLLYDYSRAGRRSTRLTSLVVKGVPVGATVAVACPRGCSRKSMTSARSGNVSLKAFVRRSLKAGTKLTVRVTRPGALGVVKTLTIRAAKRPTVATACLNLEGRRAPCAP